MALIQDTIKERVDGGYTRLFGIPELGGLISKFHATSIRAGNELEKLLVDKHTDLMTEAELDEFVKGRLQPCRRRYLIYGKVLKDGLNNFLGTSIQPDYVILIVVDNLCYVIELKDGDTFDTKKAEGEILHLRTYAKFLSDAFPNLTVLVKICSFNASSKASIVSGLKNRINETEAMTGRDFCELIGISYTSIVERRKIEAKANLKYFVSRLLDIPDIRAALLAKRDSI